jgi:UDP-N-acetylglucosamine diphosphorylase/glucosamine-1-phosphate N-acetyltransferase
MAAGRGARMDPLTRTRPKVLLPVAGRPLMGHLLAAARQAGFRRASIIVHHGTKQIEQWLGDGSTYRLDVDYVRQPKPNGTGHAVASLRGKVEGDFVLASGDSFLDTADLRSLAKAKQNTVAGQKVPDASAFGTLKLRSGRVMAIQEKVASRRAGIVNAGAYRFDEEMIARCRRLQPSPRGELELTDAITGLAKDGAPAAYLEARSWREAGRPWDLLALQTYLMGFWSKSSLAGDVGSRADIEGTVVIEKGAKVLNGCRIEGPVYIGAGATVGPNAYLRPATSIGAKCHVGNSVEVKNSILFESSNVPHLSYVGDSVIGSGCNLGAGSQVANLKVNDSNVRVHWKGKEWLDAGRRKLGVILGDDVKVGINTSFNPGTVVCPGVRVGAGQVVSGWVEPKAA